MNALFPLILPLVAGWLILEALIGSSSIPNRRLLTLSLAAPAGLGLTSVFLFLSFLFMPQAAFPLTTAALTVSAFLALQSLQKTVKSAAAPKPAPRTGIRNAWKQAFGTGARWQNTALFCAQLTACAGALFFLTLFLRSFAAGTIEAPYGEWDARLFWNVKAKFMVRNPSEWKAMFSPLLAWAHPDYPLLIPGAAAWGWLWSGHEMSFWPAFVSLVFTLSGVLVLFWFLYSTCGILSAASAAALLFSTQTLTYWGRSQMADIPLFCLITAAVVLLRQGLASRSSGLLAVSLWTAGLAAWTKNEGLLFIPVFLLFFAGGIRREGIRLLKTIPPAGFILFAAPLACTLILKKFLAGAADYLGSGRPLGEYLSLLGTSIKSQAGTTLQGMVAYASGHEWNGLWIFFGAALLLAFFKSARRPYAFISGACVLLMLAGYLIVIQTSPHPLVWQIQTAMNRLLLHLAGLAVLFSFEILSQWRDPFRD